MEINLLPRVSSTVILKKKAFARKPLGDHKNTTVGLVPKIAAPKEG